MNRRGFIGALAKGAAVAFVPTLSQEVPVSAKGIRGIMVWRVPTQQIEVDGQVMMATDYIRSIGENVRDGSVIVLPNTRDEFGGYEWDFKIVGGDETQVETRRPEVS